MGTAIVILAVASLICAILAIMKRIETNIPVILLAVTVLVIAIGSGGIKF
jgi:hypothetical protein